jgi:autotransporter-associated beta strand protein
LNETFSGVIANVNGSAVVAVNKVGAGTWTLRGANAYTGPTTVSNGELIVSTMFAGKGNFVVTNGATLGITNLSAVSALVSNLTVAVGTTLEFFNVSNTATPLMVASNVILNGNCTVKITGTNGFVVGNTYPLINYAGSFSGAFTNLQLQMPAGFTGNVVSNSHQVSLNISGVVPIPAVPANLVAVAGNAQIVASWSAASVAAAYNLKRSTTNGGPYAVIAGNVSGLGCTNSGLANGTMYYFVVSATNSAGESANSTEAGARPVSPVSTNVTFGINVGQLQLTWPFDHTGWRLQAQTNSLTGGLGTNWVDVSSNLVMNTNQVIIPMNPTNGSVFFRLVSP